MNFSLQAIAAVASLVLMTGSATAASVTFDDLPTTTDTTPLSTFTSNGVTIDITGFSTIGSSFGPAIFDTNNPTGNDNDLASPFADADGGAARDLGKGLIIGDSNAGGGVLPNDFGSGGFIELSFISSPVLFSGAIIGDIEQVNGLQFFKNGGLILEGDTRNNTNGDGLSRELSLVTPIFFDTNDTLKITYSGSGIVGSITLAAVPIPATLPLLALGLGALVVGSRRKSAKV